MTVEYQRRLEKHYDELKWLYCELYPNGQGRFEELCASMEQWYKERNKKWKALDRKREKQKNWYKSQKMLGMMLYIDAFADNISGLEEKLDYLKACNVNYRATQDPHHGQPIHRSGNHNCPGSQNRNPIPQIRHHRSHQRPGCSK